MGLDALRRYLVSGYPRHRLQSLWRLEISIALNFVVGLYRLDCIVGHSPILAACRIPGFAVDYIWRACLHLRNRVLLGEASPVQPLDLAPFRERGNSLSFLRRPLVCRVGRESRTPKQGESVETRSSAPREKLRYRRQSPVDLGHRRTRERHRRNKKKQG